MQCKLGKYAVGGMVWLFSGIPLMVVLGMTITLLITLPHYYSVWLANHYLHYGKEKKD